MSPTPVVWCLVALLLSGCMAPSPAGPHDAPRDPPLPGDGSQEAPALPGEREEERPQDLDRPGEYAILEPREGRSNATWDVPSWANGSWWRFHHELTGSPTCRPMTIDEAGGPRVRFDVHVVEVRTTEHDCDGERSGTKDRTFLASELAEMDDDGYVEPLHLFPFEDGKRWRYLRAGGVLVDAELTHLPSYTHNGTGVEAWRVDLLFSEENVTIVEWLGVEAKNVLRREIWAQGAGGLVYAVELAAYGT